MLSVANVAIMAIYLFHSSGKLNSFSLYGAKNRNLGKAVAPGFFYLLQHQKDSLC